MYVYTSLGYINSYSICNNMDTFTVARQARRKYGIADSKYVRVDDFRLVPGNANKIHDRSI